MPAFESWDVVVIGAGPAGLAAAVAAHDRGARVCIVERENRAGGVLKQCIHDGFGLVRFAEKLTGPEYASREIIAAADRKIAIYFNTFLLDLKKEQLFVLTLQSSERGVFCFQARALVAATGCRERTARQVFIHGERPSGVYTAGLVQRMINIDGWMPGRNCVILGSGDIGLIMARRLTLEGARVEGVYELKHEPSGLTRNLVQCLKDYDIPLTLGATVTTVHGRERVEGVTVVQVDGDLRPMPGTEKFVPCDTLVLSVGLIPENDILQPLSVKIDNRTKGPVVDQLLRTTVPGLFSCGNALHVNDLVDYVSENGAISGRGAADFACGKSGAIGKVPLTPQGDLLYVVPQFIDPAAGSEAVICFRSSQTMEQAAVEIEADGELILKKNFAIIRPPEMERIVLNLSKLPGGVRQITLNLKGVRVLSASDMICIQCPLGCPLQIDKKSGEIVISGHKCAKGESYAREELINPSRTLTTTVKTIFPDFPRLAVRTNREVPLQSILTIMRIVDSILVDERLRPGELALERLPGTDLSLIATDDMTAGGNESGWPVAAFY